jgi:hypothetical protein
VHEHAAFSLSQSSSTTIGTKQLSFFEALVGDSLKRYEKDFVDHEISVNKRQKIIVEDLQSSSDEEEVSDRICCECESKFGYSLCVQYSFPLKTINTFDLFDQIEERIGSHSLLAPTFDELPPGKKRWAMYWWYAVNIFHMRSKAEKLPSCFVASVRSAYPDVDSNASFTGFLTAAQRLEKD